MTNKMTYVDALNTVLDALNVVSLDDLPEKIYPAIERVTALRDSIAKRNSKNADKPRKPSKAQVANAEFAEQVFAELDGTPVTCKEMAERFEVSPQKMSAALKKLVDAGRVSKTVEKGKSYFALPDAE